jgi:hypothetical protein
MVSPLAWNDCDPEVPAVSVGLTLILTLLISTCVCTMPMKNPMVEITASQCKANALFPLLTWKTPGCCLLLLVASATAANI